MCVCVCKCFFIHWLHKMCISFAWLLFNGCWLFNQIKFPQIYKKEEREKNRRINIHTHTPITEEWLVWDNNTHTHTTKWNLMILSLLLQLYCHSCSVLHSFFLSLAKYFRFLSLCSFLCYFLPKRHLRSLLLSLCRSLSFYRCVLFT